MMPAYHQLTLLGFFMMFLSTPLYSRFGETGRLLALQSGFLILVIGIALGTLFRPQNFKLRTYVALGFSIAVYTLSIVNGQDLPLTTFTSFFLITVALIIGGMMMGADPRMESFKLSVLFLLVFLFLTLFSGISWLLFVKDLLLKMDTRVSGAETLHPVGVAYIFAVLSMGTFTIFVVSRTNIFIRLLLLVSTALFFICLIAAASRGAIISLALASLITFAGSQLSRIKSFIRGDIGYLFLKLAAVFMMVTLYILIKWTPDTEPLILKRLFSLENLSSDASSQARLDIMKHYWKRFDEFWLLGQSDYRVAFPYYPHNMFYELWVRFGLVGLAVCFMILNAIRKIVLSTWRGDFSNADYVFSGLFFLGLINGQTNLALEHNRAFWIAFGYFLTRYNSTRLNTVRTDVGTVLRAVGT